MRGNGIGEKGLGEEDGRGGWKRRTEQWTMVVIGQEEGRESEERREAEGGMQAKDREAEGGMQMEDREAEGGGGRKKEKGDGGKGKGGERDR